jgi:hypothetical protein
MNKRRWRRVPRFIAVVSLGGVRFLFERERSFVIGRPDEIAKWRKALPQ